MDNVHHHDSDEALAPPCRPHIRHGKPPPGVQRNGGRPRLDVLGSAIKYCVPPYEGASLSAHHQRLVHEAKAVAEKHGGIRTGLSPVEGFVETAEKLLGLWDDH